MERYNGIEVHQIDSAIAMVKLNRPPHNYLALPLIRAVADAYEEIARSTKTRVIVLAAEGKNFCAGGNFGGVIANAGTDASTESALPASSALSAYGEGARLVGAPLPVVAAIRGAAVGGGFGLACTADFRIGSPGTRLAPNFARLGIHHGFGLTITLPLIVGFQRANELLLTGRRIDGEEGHRLGLLDRLVDDHALEHAATEFAEEIAGSAPLAIRAIRATMRQGLIERFKAATQWEAQEQGCLGATQDFREGVLAMAERRPPVFTGR